MCKQYEASWQDLDGRPIPDSPVVEFPGRADLPTCTCWIADGTEEGDAVYAALCQELKPLFTQDYAGQIVIRVI